MAEVRINFTVDDKGAVSKIKAVGGAVEEVGKKGKGATSNMDALDAKMSKLTPTAASLGKAFAVVGVGVAAVGAAAAASVASVVSFSGALTDLASKTGTSTTFLQEWGIAGSMVGVSMEQIGNSANKLQVNLNAVGGVTGKTSEALRVLGLSLSDLKAMSPEQQFDTVASAIAGIQDPAEQAAIAVALFGKQGLELLPLIRSNFEDVKKEAQDLGIILSTETVAAADAMGDRFDLLGQAMQATVQQFGAIIVQNDAFKMAVEAVIDVVGQLNQWIIANKEEISSWVTAGILVAAQALQLGLSVIGQTIVAYGFLTETIAGVQKSFAELAITVLQSPWSQLIPGVALFRQEMLGAAETMLDNAEKSIAASQGIQGFGDTLYAASVSVGDFKENLLAQIAAGEQASTSHETLKGDIEATGTAMDETSKKALQLAQTLGFGGVQKEANAATLAIQGLGGVAMLSATGIQSLSGLIDQMRKNAMELTPELRAVALELDKIALNKGMLEVAKQMEPLQMTTEQWKDSLSTIPPELGNIDTGIQAAFGPEGQAMVGGIEKKTISFGDAMDGVNDILSEARGFMTLLGVEADSAFGKILDWVSKAFDAFNSLSGMVSKIAGIFSSTGGGGGGGILGNIAGAFTGGGGGGGSALGSLVGIGGGAAATAAGGLAVGGSFAGAGLTATVGGVGAGAGAGGIGAAISGGASAVMSGISTALAAVPVAGWIALAGIGVGLLVKKIFGGPSTFESVGEEMGRDWGEAAGVAMSEGLQHHVVNLAEDMFGGDRSAAFQMALGEIIKESVAGGNANFDLLTEKAADTYSFIERGQLTAAQGQEVLNESVAQLLPHIDELGASGVEQMERILASAEATGTGFEGISEFAVAYVQRANELGIAVNNVVLEALGLSDALAMLGATGPPAIDATNTSMGGFQAGVEAANAEVLALQAALLAAQAAGDIELSAALGSQLQAATSRANVLTDALRQAGAAAGGIDIDSGGGGGGRAEVIAATGFHSDRLSATTKITAHAGEEVHIGKPGETKAASGGGNVSLQFNISVTGGEVDVASKIADLLERDVGGLTKRVKRVLG